jgi:hypothetical protein
VAVDLAEAARRYKLSSDQSRELFGGDPNRWLTFASGDTVLASEAVHLCSEFPDESGDAAERCHRRCVAMISGRDEPGQMV